MNTVPQCDKKCKQVPWAQNGPGFGSGWMQRTVKQTEFPVPQRYPFYLCTTIEIKYRKAVLARQKTRSKIGNFIKSYFYFYQKNFNISQPLFCEFWQLIFSKTQILIFHPF